MIVRSYGRLFIFWRFLGGKKQTQSKPILSFSVRRLRKAQKGKKWEIDLLLFPLALLALPVLEVFG